jgi:sugar/nucleoside kinase (ribokinase family)
MDFEIPVEVLDYVRGNSSAVMMADLGGFGGSVSIYHPGKEYANETTLIRRIVSKFDIVKASIEDCMYIFSSKISSHEAAQLLVSWGAKIVIITLGEEGSVIFDGYDFINILPYRTKLVDTTGAGDVYCAAFISEFIKSKDLKRAGLYASSAASYIVERTGGVTVSRMPSDSEVLVRVAHLEVLRD